MAWSTRELAELAGTTLRAVRYYHEVGLLDPPERAVNGYKQYGVAHLVRVLRIRRLLDLGMTLDQVREMGDLDEHPEAELRRLDDQAREEIERLEQVRGELGELLATPGPMDLPHELARAVAADTSAEDMLMLTVMSRILDEGQLAELAELLALPRVDVDIEFEQLPVDASEDVREDLARRMLPVSLAARERFPSLPDFGKGGPDTPQRRAFSDALDEIYNPAQRDVLTRVGRMRRDLGRA
jgi:DNA-binding transcriptional MerR regulator